MQVNASIKKRCEYCIIVVRRKKGSNSGSYKPTRFVICKKNAKHKQKQG